MPDAALREAVLKRLDAAATGDNEWYPLVLAALESPEELAKQLDQTRHPEAPPSASPPRLSS